jgi:hypothetical protein
MLKLPSIIPSPANRFVNSLDDIFTCQVTLLVSFGYGPRAAGELTDGSAPRDSNYGTIFSFIAVVVILTMMVIGCWVNGMVPQFFVPPAVNPVTPQKQGFMPQPQLQTPFSPPHFQAQPHFGATPFGGITQSSPFMSTRHRSPPSSPQSGF